MNRPRQLSPTLHRRAVLTKAALRAAERLGLSGRQLAEIVGVSEATVSRLKRGEAMLEDGSKPFQLAALLVRAFRSLDAITGGDERRGARLADGAATPRWPRAPSNGWSRFRDSPTSWPTWTPDALSL